MNKKEESQISKAITKLGLSYSELENVSIKTTMKIVDLSGCSSNVVNQFINKASAKKEEN